MSNFGPLDVKYFLEHGWSREEIEELERISTIVGDGKLSAVQRARLDTLGRRIQAQLPQELFEEWLLTLTDIVQPISMRAWNEFVHKQTWTWLVSVMQLYLDRLIQTGRIIPEEKAADSVNEAGWHLRLPPQPAPKLRPSERFAILKRDNHRCQVCGAKASDNAELHVDHITPRSKGGTNDPGNLWALCYECNIGKGTQDL